MRSALAVSFAVATLVAGCGTSNPAPGEGGTPGDGSPPGDGATPGEGGSPSDGGTPGDGARAVDLASDLPSLPTVPQVVNQGGPALASPKVQLVAYLSDPMVADVEAFIAEFGKTTEWAAQTSEYGVGPFTQLPTVHLAGTPPAMFQDTPASGAPASPFQQMIAANVTGASPAWAPADGSTMYVFLVPSTSNIDSYGQTCCAGNGFFGYHDEAPLSVGSAPYAVVCECPAQKGFTLTPLQWTTTSASHELVETATDPFTFSNPAWYYTDDADLVWSLFTGGEVADMCEYNADSNYIGPGATYMIQRSWSNAAAKAGKNPCVPVPSNGPYFNSYAVYSDAIELDDGTPVMSRGVSLAPGQTRTIDVALWSEAPTAGPFTVAAYDLDEYIGSARATTVTLDKSSGQNGDVLHLTITVNNFDPLWNGAGVVLESTLNGQDNFTVFGVGLPPGTTLTSNVGASCKGDGDCGGNGLTCVLPTADDSTFGGGPANGYCSATCNAKTPCPVGATCFFGAGPSTGDGRCVEVCVPGPGLTHLNDPIDDAQKCHARPDVGCAVFASGSDVCLPLCGDDSQCPTGMHCDPRANVCVATLPTGLPSGAPCNADAGTSPCAGQCLSVGIGSGQTASICTEACELGDPPGSAATAWTSCGGATGGICAYVPSGSGAGDRGYCTNACNRQDDCDNPAFFCFAVNGLSGTSGVPNGYCFAGVACPKGQSDCAAAGGGTCTETAFGPECISPQFPLGKAGPDAGAPTDAGAPVDLGVADAAPRG